MVTVSLEQSVPEHPRGVQIVHEDLGGDRAELSWLPEKRVGGVPFFERPE